jgi:hypothetical protein
MTNKWEILKVMVAGAVLVLFTGCASQLLAIGDWGQPADLHLNEQSLAGVKVAVRCAQIPKNRPEDKSVPRKYPLCAGLERHFAALGAEVIKPDQPGADYTLWYFEEGVIEKHVSGTSVLGLIFTIGFSPIVTTATSRAELQVRDARDVVLERQTVEISRVKTFGWTALAALGHRTREKDMGEKFYRFAENRIVSQAATRGPSPPMSPEKKEAQ